MKVEVVLTFKKSVVHQHVYANPEEGFSGLYFPKHLFGERASNPPATLKITIEAQEN
jgi:hypothetical protein